MKRYKNIVIGGTFDHIHQGHETLLAKAFDVGESVLIGLTTDKYVKQYKNSKLISPACIAMRSISDRQNNGLKIENCFASWRIKNSLKIACPPSAFAEGKCRRENCKLKIRKYEIRKQHLLRWLDHHDYLDRVLIVPIDDPWGPLLTHEFPIEAIIVSKETHGRADELNRMRKKKNLAPLDIIEIPVIINQKEKIHISSTNIRAGLMDTKGNLLLPQKFRKLMREPFGPVISDEDADTQMKNDSGKMIITVGDRTTQRMLTLSMHPVLSVIDLQVERKKVEWEKSLFDRLTAGATVHECVSGPGFVSRIAVDIIQTWAEEKFPTTVLIIDGEEDLLVLPILIQAPVGAILYYGQPKVGLVRVVVDERVKAKARDYLDHFQR